MPRNVLLSAINLPMQQGRLCSSGKALCILCLVFCPSVLYVRPLASHPRYLVSVQYYYGSTSQKFWFSWHGGDSE